jgi:O-methyltransferase
MLRRWLQRARSEYGAFHNRYRDVTDAERKILETVQPFTRTSPERLLASIRAAEHVCVAKVPGDIVECGVWRGGSSMAMALALGAQGDTGRRLFLYDTFEGMTAATSADVDDRGQRADALLAGAPKTEGGAWAIASLEDVKRNMRLTRYPDDRIVYVPGPVEHTLTGSAPEQIALLRLDTDWYESTKAEMDQLYPRLAVGGVLIIDDYGHWQGARRAVDEYFAARGEHPFLHRTDYTGRVMTKFR